MGDLSLSGTKPHSQTQIVSTGNKIIKDYVGLKTQPKLLALFGSGIELLSFLTRLLESLLFSDKIKKVNMFGWSQERFFVITTEKVYNLKKNKIKRFIPVILYP